MQKLYLTGYAWYGFIYFVSSYVLLISVFSHQIALKEDFGPEPLLAAIFGIPTGLAFRALNRPAELLQPL
jgi:hypothetical protein